jgi:hypothetical protein
MSNRTMLILVLLALVVVCLYTPLGHSLSKVAFSAGIPGDMSVLGPGALSPEDIDRTLCTAHSPACGTGQAMYQDAHQFNISAAYALATFHEESSYGLAGVARATRGLGNIRCSAGYQCVDGFRAYATYAAGYADFFSLIRTLYIDTWHLTTVRQIIPRYAPSNENNVSAYCSVILADMTRKS